MPRKNAKAIRRQRLDGLYLAKYGCSFDEWKKIPPRARRAFHTQKFNAKYRGIGWEILLKEWWDIWLASGKWETRGKGIGHAMCRLGDTGPYSPKNVFIASGAKNSEDGQVHKQIGRTLPKGVGVAKDQPNNPYIAYMYVKGKYKRLGSFPTPEAAGAAYTEAAKTLLSYRLD